LITLRENSGENSREIVFRSRKEKKTTREREKARKMNINGEKPSHLHQHTHQHNTTLPRRKRAKGKTHTSYRVWTGENAREDTSMAGEGERETVVMPKSQWR